MECSLGCLLSLESQWGRLVPSDRRNRDDAGIHCRGSILLRRAEGFVELKSMVETDAGCVWQLCKWRLEQAGRFQSRPARLTPRQFWLTGGSLSAAANTQPMIHSKRSKWTGTIHAKSTTQSPTLGRCSLRRQLLPLNLRSGPTLATPPALFSPMVHFYWVLLPIRTWRNSTLRICHGLDGPTTGGSNK